MSFDLSHLMEAEIGPEDTRYDDEEPLITQTLSYLELKDFMEVVLETHGPDGAVEGLEEILGRDLYSTEKRLVRYYLNAEEGVK